MARAAPRLWPASAGSSVPNGYRPATAARGWRRCPSRSNPLRAHISRAPGLHRPPSASTALAELSGATRQAASDTAPRPLRPEARTRASRRWGRRLRRASCSASLATSSPACVPATAFAPLGQQARCPSAPGGGPQGVIRAPDASPPQATLSGAIDIIAVRHDDGTYLSTPFHVRFGRLRVRVRGVGPHPPRPPAAHAPARSWPTRRAAKSTSASTTMKPRFP